MIEKLTKISAISFIALSATLLAFANPAQAQTGISKIGQIGGYTSSPLNFPNSVTIDDQGNIFVINRDDKEILKYNENLEYQSKFGESGNGNGQLNYPLNSAFDSLGNMYITEYPNNRVQKFDSQGNYISQFGVAGSGNGEFNWPEGIAIDNADSVYVVDSHNDRIQIFNAAGQYQSQFGTTGSGNGEFNNPQSIAIDSAGFLYVTDGDNHRVQKFDSQGNYISQFGTAGSGNGEFSEIYGIAIASSNDIYVSDAGSGRIQIFNSASQYQSEFGSQGSNAGQFNYPRGITVDSVGDIYVADSENDRIQKCTSQGNCDTIISNPDYYQIGAYTVGVGQNQVFAPSVVNDLDNSGLHVSNLFGTSIQIWPPVDSLDYMVAPSPNFVYTIAAFDGDVFKFKKMNYNGQTLATWDLPGLGYGIAADTQDNLYWFNQSEAKIVKYSSNGTILNQFGSEGTGDGQFGLIAEGASFLATDNQDNLYVSDTFNHRIQKFDSNGNFLMQFGSEGIGPGQFTYAGGIAINNFGDIYVADYAGSDSRIQRFNSSGGFISQYLPDPEIYYGERGFEPYGLAVGPNGRLFVALPGSGSIDILCDHDVSSDNCASAGGGASGQTLTYPDSEKGTTVSLILPSDVTSPSVSAVDPDTIPKDGENQFPAGLTSFQFTTSPGATKTVTLYYDLPGNPSSYTARKYKTNSQTFIDVPGATITREDYNGKSMLKLTYSIADGGILDQDGLANGTVIDPVGLATTALADTGENLWLYALGIIALLGFGVWMQGRAEQR